MSTIDQLKKLHEAANPGPWRFRNGYCMQANTELGYEFDDALWSATPTLDDADLIVLLRNSLPHFIELYEAAKQAIAETDALPIGPGQFESIGVRRVKAALAKLEGRGKEGEGL